MNRRKFLGLAGSWSACILAGCATGGRFPADKRPNIIFIMSDDHAAHALSCCGSAINKTPYIDRLASEGILFEKCFCTNAICAPSRAVILTGKYSHINGKIDNDTKYPFDGSQQTLPKLLGASGYQTAIIGKWHLASDPTGFDYWNILPGQGDYHDPDFVEMGRKTRRAGYVTDLITDFSIDWLNGLDRSRPFFLMCHHKAPHRNWQPDDKHADMYKGRNIPLPRTFDDDYATRCAAAAEQKMTVEKYLDVPADTKAYPPKGLAGEALKRWKYQRYMEDYLACVASVDDNVGRLLNFLDSRGLAENTIVAYTSDQGFFLGDHGWFDKRFMYEHSLRMPLLIRWPGYIKAASKTDAMVLNLDFAPTLLAAAGVEIPADIQGESFLKVLRGKTPENWRKEMYYHYYEYPGVHSVKRHYGIRTDRYKLIHFYNDIDCWELYDLKKDPDELNNLFGKSEYAQLVRELKDRLRSLQLRYKDPIVDKTV